MKVDRRDEKIFDGAPRKDNNFTNENMRLKISEEDYKRVVKMIRDDCEFLEQKQIIDYSLLIGIYEKERAMSKNRVKIVEEEELKKKSKLIEEAKADQDSSMKEIGSRTDFKKALKNSF